MFNDKAVHLVLQGKGGVGKSLIASLLVQLLLEQGDSVRAIDTDPLNDSLTQTPSLHATHLDILDKETSSIDPLKFDPLIAAILENPTAHFVVDNGTASFLPLYSYLVQNEVLPYLQEHGRRLLIHVPIVAGTAYLDTVQCFDSLAATFKENARIVAWLNPYFGQFKEPFSFLKSSAFLEHKNKLGAIIEMPPFRNPLFQHAFEQMLHRKQTISDAIASPDTQIMAKQRLTIYRRELFPVIEGALVHILNVQKEVAHS